MADVNLKATLKSANLQLKVRAFTVPPSFINYIDTSLAAVESDRAEVANNTAIAETKAGEASASATDAASSAQSASDSASAASTSETNAAASENTASDAATTSTDARDAAQTAESNAASSASAASTSESNAAESESNAASSASEAQTAETQAKAARDTTASLLDQFGDRYLGDHDADPETDNDGDPLNEGDVYFNTTENVLKFYSGSAWVAPEDVATTAASNAEASADAAATSESNAASSEQAAETAESGAVTAETNAQGHASDAATSASNAATSESNASSSETAAQNAQDAAETAESNAQGHESAAQTARSGAESAESTALSHKNDAATSASNAADSATTAENAASTAQSAADTAEANAKDYTDAEVGDLAFRRQLLERIERDATLLLDFANNRYRIYEGLADGNTEKSYSDIVTHTRASDATGFNALGTLSTVTADTQRLVFSPETGRSEGLLVEEERTNLIEYSEAFDNTSYWNHQGDVSVTDSGIPAPDGTMTAKKITGTRSGEGHIFRNEEITEATLSIYARTTSGTGIVRVTGRGGSAEKTVTDKWQRFDTYVESGETDAAAWPYVVDFRVEGGLEEVHVWGFQAEQAPTPSSYIKTEGTAVTRAADVVSQDEAGKWLNRQAITFIGRMKVKSYEQFASFVGSNERDFTIISPQSNSNTFPSELSVDVRGITSFSSNPSTNIDDVDISDFVFVVSMSKSGGVFSVEGRSSTFPLDDLDLSQISSINIFDRGGDGSVVNTGMLCYLKTLPYALTEPEAIALTQPEE